MERTIRKERDTAEMTDKLQHTRFAPSTFRSEWLEKHGQLETPSSLSAAELLKRPGITLSDLKELAPELGEYSREASEQSEIRLKYEGYLGKQDALIRKARQMEETLLDPDIEYEKIGTLRLEARQKLDKQKPVSLAAASRIPGVTPADIAVLMVWLEARRRDSSRTPDHHD